MELGRQMTDERRETMDDANCGFQILDCRLKEEIASLCGRGDHNDRLQTMNVSKADGEKWRREN